ncbi:unnamed protein product, partial [Staurois parvus]
MSCQSTPAHPYICTRMNVNVHVRACTHENVDCDTCCHVKWRGNA